MDPLEVPFGGRTHFIPDDLSTDTTASALAEGRELRITFAPTSTDASHLNPIKTHFRTIRWWAFTRTN